MHGTRDDALSRLPDPGALVFDLDGTLVDTVRTRIDGWLRAFAEIDLPADRDHVARLIGSDGKRLAKEVAQAADRELDEQRAEELDRRAGQLYDVFNVDPRPLPGARDLLSALHSGARIPWAIATSSRAQQVLASVDALRLPRRPLIVDGSHVRHAKPDPDLLLLAAERLGVEPGRCWCIGDATWDVTAARAGGLVSIGIATGAVDGRALTDAGADATLASLVDLHLELAARGCVDAPPQL